MKRRWSAEGDSAGGLPKRRHVQYIGDDDSDSDEWGTVSAAPPPGPQRRNGGAGGDVIVLSDSEGDMSGYGAAFTPERLAVDRHELDRQVRIEQDIEYRLALEADRKRKLELSSSGSRSPDLSDSLMACEPVPRPSFLPPPPSPSPPPQKRPRLSESASAQSRFLFPALLIAEPTEEQREEACTLKVRLPNGATCQRRFFKASPIKDVFIWAQGQLVKQKVKFDDMSKAKLVRFPDLAIRVADDLRRTLEECALSRPSLLHLSID